MSAKAADVRIGIVGIGNMGSSHAKLMLDNKIPGATLAAICDTNPKRFEAFPGIPHWTDSNTMLREAKIDAVVIATPHYDHTTIGIAALTAGFHVLVEKPISVHKADAQRLIDTKRTKKQVFSAMFNQRTDPRYRWLKQHIESGDFGRINRVNWIITDWFRSQSYYDHGAWRATWEGEGGGVLLNQCPHQLDLMQWLFGMPVAVRAFCQRGRFHEIEVEDDVTAYLEYANGANGVFITTTGEAPGTNRLEVAAENGRIIVEGNTISIIRNMVPTSAFCKTSDKPFAGPENITETVTFKNHGEQHTGIFKNFVAAIKGEAELIAPAVEGINSVELANAMILSGQQQKTITLPLDAAAYEKNLKSLIRNSKVKKAKTVKAGVVADMSQSF
ncbi:MAG TPA: oxidoreductase [Verrucomicrobia bacterium]|nr:oxidoreductase [Verrucomicrobiota bacterium]